MRVLVVGANGSVGSRCCLALLTQDVEVRGSVREQARGADLAAAGVEIVEADLVSARGLSEALHDVEAVILTANPITPRRGDDPTAVEEGLLRLVGAAAAVGVRRLVLASVPESPAEDRVPFAAARRRLESVLDASPMETVIVRFPPFMGCWLALVGSSIPLRGDPHATISRPSPFLRAFRRGTATLVEHRGLMLVPGSASMRNAFIEEDDVAAALVGAALRPDLAGRTIQVGGPQVLSWREVADIYAALLGRTVRILGTPAPVYAALSALLRPVASVPANTMALNRFMASAETPWPAGGADLVDPGQMTTVTEFLAAKLRLPEELPEVV